MPEYEDAVQGRKRVYANAEQAEILQEMEITAVKWLMSLGYEIHDEFGRDMREFKL